MNIIAILQIQIKKYFLEIIINKMKIRNHCHHKLTYSFLEIIRKEDNFNVLVHSKERASIMFIYTCLAEADLYVSIWAEAGMM